jgi:hypothetical protein
MLTLLSALGSLLSFRVRSRLTLELELVAPRHQVTFIGTLMPGEHRFLSKDRCFRWSGGGNCAAGRSVGNSVPAAYSFPATLQNDKFRAVRRISLGIVD